MVKHIRHIALILLMLLFGGIGNEALAYKVTYHILTLPFTTKNSSDGVNLTDRFTDIRVEAIRVIVDDATQIELPSHFKSPLATQSSFRYYDAANVTKRLRPGSSDPQYSYFDSNNRAQIYQYMTTKYEIYDIPTEGDSIPKASRTSISGDREIFVVYTYNPSNGIVILDGTQDYNIKLGDRFLCFNRDRANRPAAIKAQYLSEENLTSNDFTYVATPGFNNNQHHNFHFRFKFEGNDPYNIVLRSSYNGDVTFRESDKALGKTVTKYYKGASLFLQGKQDASNNMWLASDDEIQYTQTNAAGEVTYVQKPGFYRGGNGGSAEMNPIWNSFAMLNADNGEGYVFMATKINSNGKDWQPGGKNGTDNTQFLYLTGNVDSGNNPRFQWKTASTAESTDPEIYEVREYTYKVKTPLTEQVITATVTMSEYLPTATLLTHVPEVLKRNYATFTGAYADDALSTPMTTFADVETADNGRVIWLKYSTSMPFDALPKNGSYTDAHWYTLRMNGQAENQYVTYLETGHGGAPDGNFSTGRGSNDADKLHQGENSPEAMFAFIGDPFELQILSRSACESASANRYVGCANGTSTPSLFSVTEGTSKESGAAINRWEIARDDQTGTMILREIGTYASPKYIGWDYNKAILTENSISYSGTNPIIYHTTGSRIKVVELEKKKYLYHIVRSDGSIAVEASKEQDLGAPLNLANIPEIISSPFVSSVTFYWTKTDADAGTSAKSFVPYTAQDAVASGVYANIYVRYTPAGDLTGDYNVRLNGEYIYWDTGTSSIKSVADIGENAGNNYYQWHLDLSDPYNMLILNKGTSNYIKVSSWINEASLGWDESIANASKFIAQSSKNVGVYEVMAATGAGVDASETYYHIGRNNTGVKMFSNATYEHLDDELRFRLTATTASDRTYHLIDKSGSELLTVVTRQVNGDAPRFPTDYWSPLVAKYNYYLLSDFTVDGGKYTLSGSASELATVGSNTNVYVTYDVNDNVNMQKGVLYLLKFRTGDNFRQEDGADNLLAPESEFTGTAIAKKARYQAVYPYCNGDCNFFVYGEEQYDIQQQGAASTRTRWAWFVESANNDPYHVKICSRQTETYNSAENSSYFHTYLETFGDGTKHVVTGLAWPGISGEQASEYMVLGSVGQYKLVTTNTIPVDLNDDGDTADEGESNQHHIVNSFEQYWKTFDTIRKKIYGESSAKAKATDPITVPNDVYYKFNDPTEETLRHYLENDLGFHSYSHWAYAKRWNGYNKPTDANPEGEAKKGWEELEHWYQTVNMGQGYFDFVETTIDPALILLDQHGWEIMRKPLPSSPDDPNKAIKYAAIKPYDSPMVKEYIFWASAKKRTGMHQYYLMDKRIGGDFTSTSLTNLPPYGSENVLDAKGNLNDQYVTYIVKDEYAQSYTPSSKAGAPFIIQQGNNYASNDGTATVHSNTVPSGGMPQYIIDNIGTIFNSGNSVLWFIKPNADIDTEMGYTESNHSWGTSNPNAYEDALYKDNRVADFITGTSTEAKALIKKYGSFTFSNGFDPYNIQISSVSDNTKYFVTNATGAILEDGDLEGTYSTTPTLTLGAVATEVTSTWYDNLTQHPTNATFMAVQDENGNIQLMPRFDHSLRVRDFTKIETPTEQAGDANKLKEMQTKLFRPMAYNYRIIDNDGHEALRYRSAGELSPYIPNHFKSPLAKDYIYYKDLTLTDGVYTEVSTKADISSKEITSSLAGANLTATNLEGNVVYVRYSYDAEADVNYILKGQWFTMQLNEKDAKYDSGIKQGSSKPATVDGDEKAWQWKLLETRNSVPDPYAVYLFNRSQTEGTKAISNRFALLSHTSGGYSLAEAGTEAYTYSFLNGASMTTSVAATIGSEADFKSMSCEFDGTKSQVKLLDDVVHTYTYKIYTNGTNGSNAVKYGVFAISGTQSQAEASQNEFVPVIPEAIRTPLLEPEEFLFYEKEADMGDATKELPHLYGLYDDDVYVRYKPYSDITTGFKVPNAKTTIDGHVARDNDHSNDASLMLNGSLLYNIVWYNDNMMKNDGDDIKGHAGQNIQASAAYEWTFEGNDPYAIKIKSIGATKYINASATLDTEANVQTFMLLPKDDYDYGVLAKTGDKDNMLTIADDDNTGTLDAASIGTGDPTKFIIFALATHKVIYHLVIKNINDASTLTIPYHEGTVESPDGSLTTLTINGTTLRDLTTTASAIAGETYQLGSTINGQTYSYDAGAISLGDVLQVPNVFYRPNVVYEFVVEGVYSDEDCAEGHVVSDMNNKYKGFKVTKMGDDTGLLGKTVRVNIIYGFQTGLETNSGEGFVTNVNQKKWYTVETNDNSGTRRQAQYTNAWGLEVKEGRGTHYTNDYLWSPVGDPYGFKLYNRYIYKNSGADNSGEDKVITSYRGEGDTEPFKEAKRLFTDAPSDPYCVYELLSAPTAGYFRIHPVVNNSGDQYYFKTFDTGDGVFVKLSTQATEFTFGLSKDLFDPYFKYVGYIGALKRTVYDDPLNATLVAAMESDEPLSYENMLAAQELVYTDSNIEPFVSGYYRLHSPSGIEGISPIRYASGYTHLIEANDYDCNPAVDADGDGSAMSDILPMHFYEKEGVTTTFENLISGFTVSNATRGDLTVPAVEYDPASIFYISGTDETDVLISTQGLYVKGTIGRTEDNGSNEATTLESTSPAVRAKAIMTSNVAQATHLWMMDIGGGVFLIHDRSIPKYRKYLSYHQNDGANIYDLKLTHNTHTDHAKWCLQPANMLGLNITTYSGGDGDVYGTSYNYASFYAPFDILLPDDATELEEDEDRLRVYEAFICDSKNSPWSPPSDLHPKAIGRYSVASDTRPSAYNNSNKFVPAGTPVLLAMWDPTGYVKVTLPTSEPSTSLLSGLTYTNTGETTLNDCENILTGAYLERLLLPGGDVYVFGLPFNGTINKADNFEETGIITATLPTHSNTGLGFYLNANQDKESGISRSSWTRNNWYILGNKVYYREIPTPAKERNDDVQYVPVLFDDDVLNFEEEDKEGKMESFNSNAVYDLQGRRVVSGQSVIDGTWRESVTPGIYIYRGKKLYIK